MQEDKEIMRHASVIGMTTTGSFLGAKFEECVVFLGLFCLILL